MSGDVAFDAFTEEARARLAAWPPKSRQLFGELLEDAGSELQRELLQRAVAAGHSPAEVHAFADELRPLGDDEAYEACTLESGTEGYTVDQLLRAESDPLFAFELKGGALSPSEEPASTPGVLDLEAAGYQSRSGRRHGFDEELGVEDPAPWLQAKAERFQAESAKAPVRRRDLRHIGESVEHTPKPAKPREPVASGAKPKAELGAGAPNRLMEDLVNEATRALGVTFREHEVDLPQGLTLEAALSQAASTSSRGVPIPIALGPEPGTARRFAVLLQSQVSGKNRAWQLYDPLTQELAWANEGDLLARRELPLSSKADRRVTRIALPVVRGADL